MNGVSDITFLRPLSTQDIHICCIVIAGKKEKREGGKERRKRRKEGMKYVAVRMDIVVFYGKQYYFNAQCAIVPVISTEGISYQMKTS